MGSHCDHLGSVALYNLGTVEGQLLDPGNLYRIFGLNHLVGFGVDQIFDDILGLLDAEGAAARPNPTVLKLA